MKKGHRTKFAEPLEGYINQINGNLITQKEYDELCQDKNIRSLNIEEDDAMSDFEQVTYSELHNWGTAISEKVSKDRVVREYERITSLDNIRKDTQEFGKPESYGILDLK